MLTSEEPREGKALTRGSVVGAESATAPPPITWAAITDVLEPFWLEPGLGAQKRPVV